MRAHLYVTARQCVLEPATAAPRQSDGWAERVREQAAPSGTESGKAGYEGRAGRAARRVREARRRAAAHGHLSPDRESYQPGKGQSAVAAAAYRSGERLRDEQADEQKFYQARAERIEFTAIMAPKDAPDWAQDRNQLWNHAERAEKRKDAQLAREIEISLAA